MSISNNFYSRKGLTAEEKIEKQLQFAVYDPNHNKKWFSKNPFALSFSSEKLPNERVFTPLSYAVSQTQNSRPYQEDRYIVKTDVNDDFTEKSHLFGVFDGHGEQGAAAEFVKDRIALVLGRVLSEFSPNQYSLATRVANAFTETFARLADEYQKSGGKGGTTATCALFIENEIYIANVGDSSAIYVAKEQYIPLTEEASASKERFQKFYRNNPNVYFAEKSNEIRLCCETTSLNVVRAVGGMPFMCTRPKITQITENMLSYYGRGFLVLSSDGLSCVGTTPEVAYEVHKLFNEKIELQEMTDKMAEFPNVSKLRSDNLTVMIISI